MDNSYLSPYLHQTPYLRCRLLSDITPQYWQERLRVSLQPATFPLIPYATRHHYQEDFSTRAIYNQAFTTALHPFLQFNFLYTQSSDHDRTPAALGPPVGLPMRVFCTSSGASYCSQLTTDHQDPGLYSTEPYTNFLPACCRPLYNRYRNP